MFTTPILFVIFNRPDTTKIVFEKIREIQPTKLFIAADAPRIHKVGEKDKCELARSIVNFVDWDCEVKTLFQTENLGCKKAVSSAISWFFGEVEQGIILEDDCLPDITFFEFCQELLEKYKNDERIGHINGTCHLSDIIPSSFSYSFSSITYVWGWATWRRVWKNVNIDFPFWNQYPEKRQSLFINKWEKIYFTSFISDALKSRNGMNPWGVFYTYSLRLQNQLSIYPSINLITNIGLNDPEATHTKKNNNKLIVKRSSMSFPLVHPIYILNDKDIHSAAMKKNYFSYQRLLRYIFKLY